jgi:phosphoribosylformylglycinamidine (FGAM) synthase-like enzyme
VMNLACVGARPLGLVNCLNFGNPEHPEVMWQLSEAIDGMAEACRAFGIPVVGGNVSLYNESQGRNIDPTPVVGMLGLVDQLDQPPPGARFVDGGRLLVLGADARAVSGSRWAWDRGLFGGRPPALDLDAHLTTATLVRNLVAEGLLAGVHDAADGLGVALAEMAVRSGLGCTVDPKRREASWLFAESASRVVVCARKGRAAEVVRAAQSVGVTAVQLGVAGGRRFTVRDLVDLDLDAVVAAWRDRLPRALGAGTAH